MIVYDSFHLSEAIQPTLTELLFGSPEGLLSFFHFILNSTEFVSFREYRFRHDGVMRLQLLRQFRRCHCRRSRSHRRYVRHG